MAIYEYHCPSCNVNFEFEHPMREKPDVHCPTCDAVATRVFTPSGMVLKGSGFYNTDYGTSSSAPAAAAPCAHECANESCPAHAANN
jgi:putative FmdB family regulatory protein